jgi:hypothetical protein
VSFLNLEQFTIKLSRNGSGGVLLSFGPEILTVTTNNTPSTLPIALAFYYEVDTGGSILSDYIEIIEPYTITPNGTSIQKVNEPLPIVTPTGTIQNMAFVVTVGQSITGPPVYVNYNIGSVSGIFVNCLAAGTPVLTPEGYKPIETLRKDDLIVTNEGHQCPLQSVFCQTVPSMVDSARMFRVPAGRFGAKEEFMVSKWHKILTEEGWIEAYRCGLEEIPPSSDIITLYHLSVENWESNPLVVAGGCVVESWSGSQPQQKGKVDLSSLPLTPKSKEFKMGYHHIRSVQPILST